jgi:hypothetical protein
LYRYCFNSPTNGTDPSGLAENLLAGFGNAAAFSNEVDNALGTDIGTTVQQTCSDLESSIATSLSYSYTSPDFHFSGEAGSQLNSYTASLGGQLAGTVYDNTLNLTQSGFNNTSSITNGLFTVNTTMAGTSFNHWNLDASGTTADGDVAVNGFLSDNYGKFSGGVNASTQGPLSVNGGYNSLSGLNGGVTLAPPDSNLAVLLAGSTKPKPSVSTVVVDKNQFVNLSFGVGYKGYPLQGIDQNQIFPTDYFHQGRFGDWNFAVGVEILLHGPSGGSSKIPRY